MSGGDSAVQCCAPVTGMRACGESAGAAARPAARRPRERRARRARGGVPRDEGSAVFVLPDTNVAVVSLGRTVAGSDRVPGGARACHRRHWRRWEPGGRRSARGASPGPRRDDYALLKVLWGAVRPAAKAGRGRLRGARRVREEPSRTRCVHAFGDSADVKADDVKEADVRKRKTRERKSSLARMKTAAATKNGAGPSATSSPRRSAIRSATR